MEIMGAQVSADNGKTWSQSTLVLSTTLQPGTNPAESIAGKWFPQMCGGKGGMVLICDGGPGDSLYGLTYTHNTVHAPCTVITATTATTTMPYPS